MGGKSYQQRGPSLADREAEADVQGPTTEVSEQQEESGGVMGWARATGHWISETYDQTAESVSNWVDIADEAGDLEYDLDLDQITATGPLREVLEVAVRAGQVGPELLQLLEGAQSDNVVTMTYGFLDGTVQIRSDELMLQNFSAGGVQLEKARMLGVDVMITSADIGLMADESGGTQATVRASKVEAEGVSFVGQDGPVTVGTAQVTDFAFTAQSTGTELLDREGVTASLKASVVSAQDVDWDGSHLDSVGMSDLDASMVGADETASLGVGHMSARGLTQGGIKLGNANASGVQISVDNAGGGVPMLDEVPDQLSGRVDVNALAVTDFQHPQGSVGAAILEHASASYGEAESSASAESLTAAGLDSEWAKAEVLSAKGMSVSDSAGTQSFAMDSMRGQGVTSDQAAVGNLSATGLEGSVTGEGQQATLASLRAETLETSAGEVGVLELQRLQAQRTEDQTTAQLARADAYNVDGEGLDAETLRLRGITANQNAGGVHGSIASGSVSKLDTYGATLSSGSATDVDFAADGSRVDVGIQALEGTEGSYDDFVAARSLSVQDAQVGVQGDDVTATAASAEVRGVDTPNLDSDAVFGSDVRIGLDEASSNIDVGSMAAFGSTLNERITVQKAEAHGLYAGIGQDRYALSADRATMEGARDTVGGSTVGNADLQGLDVAASSSATSASVDRLRMGDARLAGTDTGGGGAPDMATIVRSAASRIDDADIRARVGLTPGEMGPATIKPGTDLSAHIAVQDNEFTKFRTSTSQGVDLPAWLEAHGTYLDKDGDLKADLSGFVDVDAGEHLNSALGLPGEQMPSVSEMGAALAPTLAGPSTGQSPVNMDNHVIYGQVGMSPGPLDVGAADLQLQREREGDNVVELQSQGGKALSLATSRILAGSVDVDMGRNTSLSAGRTSVDNANMQVGNSGLTGTATGVDARSVSYRGPGMNVASTGTQAQTPSSGVGTIEVRRGDSLGALAARNGTTVDALARANGISDPNKIFVGQRLTLP